MSCLFLATIDIDDFAEMYNHTYIQVDIRWVKIQIQTIFFMLLS